MKYNMKISIIICLFIIGASHPLFAQKHKKVRVKNKIVAYDYENNEIDSLTKDLKNQAKSSKYLDEVQVKLRQIELTLQSLKEDPENEKKQKKMEAKKLRLLDSKMSVIEDIQNEKSTLVKEYYIIIESFKDPDNAMAAIRSWRKKGYENTFIFYNTYRGWYYIAAKRCHTYSEAIKYQFELQKQKIPNWIYYWAE